MNRNVSAQFRALSVASALVLATSTLLVLSSSQARAATYAIPTAPTNVTAHSAASGILVKWTAVEANPPVTSYLVSAGPGSCPIFVPARNHTLVTMPVLPGQTGVTTPTVQAVNAYGISPVGTSTKTFTATEMASVSKNLNLKSLQIIQFSDFHGAIDGTATAAGTGLWMTAFANDRKLVAATFTVAAGDNFGASPALSNEFEEIPSVESLNLMKLDASALGNHEHDRPLAHLNKVIGLSNFQWLAANYSSLEGMKSGSKVVKPYTIIDRGGIKLGIVGGNTEEVPEVVFPGNLSYTDATGAKKDIQISASATPLAKAAADAKAAGADIVIAVLHQGWAENANGMALGRLNELAPGIKGAAVVFGGHSHQVFSTVLPGDLRKAPVLVTEVANSASSYNRVQICFNPSSKKIIGQSLQNVATASLAKLTPDAEGTALVKKYKDILGPKLDVKIGQVNAIFPRGGSPAVERSGQTAMGDFMADTLRAKLKTDFAIVNGGGIRDTFPATTYKPSDATLNRPGTDKKAPYDVTIGDVLTVFPFGNAWAKTKVTGTALWAAMENGVSQYPAAGRFPQISGFKFVFDPTAPVGSRISGLAKSDGTLIAKDSTEYTLATVDYMITGGDGYVDVFQPSKATIGGLLADLLIEKLKADMAAGKVTVAPVADGRITKK